ncbi:MAG: hypothetical protein JSS66_07770 [Armatimonadetes bacterium]|nr:hypothetical protein [Armatimonadota bacterium]
MPYSEEALQVSANIKAMFGHFDVQSMLMERLGDQPETDGVLLEAWANVLEDLLTLRTMEASIVQTATSLNFPGVVIGDSPGYTIDGDKIAQNNTEEQAIRQLVTLLRAESRACGAGK